MVHGVLLDIDGVLTVSWHPLPGAAETVRWLQQCKLPFRLITNTSSKSRAQISELLERAGMPIDHAAVLTAVSSAAAYLREHHPGATCYVLNEGGDLTGDLDGVTTAGIDDAEVVLLGGAGASMSYSDLDAVFRRALDGVPVIALHRNTRYQTADGPALDMGAFVAGIEAAANIEVTVVGKPAPDFFHAALRDAGIDAPGAVVVGDDLASDVLGAQAVGCTGVLVRTGKFRTDDLERLDGQPDHVIDDVGRLPDLLEDLG